MRKINRINRKSTSGFTLWLIILFLLFFSSFSFAAEPAWELVSMNPPRGTVRSISLSKDGKIFIGSEGGAFSSYDNGKNWNKLLDGYTIPLVINQNGTLFTRQDNQKLFLSSFLISYDSGISWNIVKKKGTDWIVVDSTRTLLSHLNDSTYNAEFYLSNDDVNWNLICSIPDSLIENYIAAKTYFKDSVIAQSVYDIDYHIYIVISNDLGKTWKKIKLQQNRSIDDFIIKSAYEFYAASSHGGIFYTKNGGLSWSLLWLSDKNIYKLLFFEKYIFACTVNGISYSSNNGDSWQFSNISNELNNSNQLSADIEIDSTKNLYSAPFMNGVYISNDNCKTWQESNNGFSALAANDMLFINNEIFITCWGYFKSTDAGKSFKYLGMKSLALDPIAVNSKGEIFTGDNSYTITGIYRSSDDGITWKNLGLSSIYAIVINSKDIIFVAPGYISTDNGETWSSSPPQASFAAVNDEGHFFGFSYGRINRSTDDGLTWNQIATTKVDPTYNEYGGKIIFNNRTKTAAYYDLITTDNGRTWKKQEDSGYSFGSTSTNEFAIDSTYNWVYASDNYILRSTENGKSWKRMDTTGFKTNSFQTIGCSPDGHIYVFGSTGGLYRSRDAFVSVSQKVMDNIYNVSISPNPARTKIKLDIPIYKPSDFMLFHQNEMILVYDILGACVLQVKPDLENAIYNDNQIELDISSLPTGAYYLRYGRYSQHFVKCSN